MFLGFVKPFSKLNKNLQQKSINAINFNGLKIFSNFIT